jgi:UDP-GlcNAc:undecaprenyl-phosphate GlcNAc-1-phosphate transferase
MHPLKRNTYRAALLLFIILIIPFTKKLFTSMGVRWAYILSLSLTTSYLLTPLLVAAASVLGFFDIPSHRKIHSQPTPLMGGIAIYVAFMISVLANSIFSPKVIGILIGSTLVAGTGLVDDIVGVNHRLKLFIQLIATVIVMYTGVSLILMPQAWIGSTIVNGFLTILWIVGITNAMNFFDGMDGLAAGLSSIISFFLGILAFQTHQPFLGWLAIAVMGSSLGFMPYNFRLRGPATIFMGDSGSYFVGFLLACLAVLGEWAKKNPIVSISAPLLIFGVLIFDMVYLTLMRFHSGKVKNLIEWLDYKGGKDHMHHRLAEVLSSQRRTVVFIFLLSSCLGLTSTVLRHAQTVDAFLLFLQAVVILVLVTILESVVRWRKEAPQQEQTVESGKDTPIPLNPESINEETP